MGRSQISSAAVARALAGWKQAAALPCARLSGEHNDWTQIIGSLRRDDPQLALVALPARRATGLRAAVERADVEFCAKTLPDPHADLTTPWWWR